MPDFFSDENSKEQEESFAELLDHYNHGSHRDVRVGDKIQGKIISIGKDTVFVETGTKLDGVVDKAELTDDNGQITYKEGDVLELFIVSRSEDEIKLSKAISGIGGLQLLQETYAKAIPVEGKIIESCKGGFRVELLRRRAFCPISQIDLEYVKNPEDYIGKTYRFLVALVESNGKNIVLSRRALLVQELETSRKQFYKTLSLGAILEAKITRLMPFGAFAELAPGVEGMIHVSELSWSKTARPDEIVKTGDLATVKVIGIEPTDRPEQLKIALSIKQVSADPWICIDQRFSVGEKLKGIVTRCVPFGAFIEIAPGIEGLVHVSEMSYTKRVAKPQDIISEGESVSVVIKEIDHERRRLSMSMRDAEGDPWLDVSEMYTVGQTIVGTIEKKEKFGTFVTLSPGITGLLPRSNFQRSSNPALLAKLNEGDAIAVIIEALNPRDRKISLAPVDAKDEQNWKNYSPDNPLNLGSLGEKLQQAMAAKNK